MPGNPAAFEILPQIWATNCHGSSLFLLPPEIPYSASDCKSLDELEAWHQRAEALAEMGGASCALMVWGNHPILVEGWRNLRKS